MREGVREGGEREREREREEKETKTSHKALMLHLSKTPSSYTLIPGEPMKQRLLNDTVLDLEKNHLRTAVASDQKNGKTHNTQQTVPAAQQ